MPSADYRFHDLLRVRINHDAQFLLGPLLSRYAAYRAEPSGEPDLVVNLGPFSRESHGAYKVDDRIWIKEGYLACEHRYKVARWRMEIKGLENGPTVLNVDANVPARLVIAGDTVPSMIRYKLAQKGATLVHGSAVEKDGRALVFSGRSGAGKTITATRFQGLGWRHLGDDSCILRQGRVYGFIQPFTVRFTYDAKALFRNPFTLRERALIRAKRMLSLASGGRINLLTSLSPHRVLSGALGTEGACDSFVMLQGGGAFRVDGGFSRRDAVEHALANIGFESRELDAYLQAYAHVYPFSPLARFWEDQAAHLANALEGSRTLKITVPSLYTDEVFAGIRAAVERP